MEGTHARSTRLLVSLANSPARFKKAPTFDLAIDLWCEASGERLQIAAAQRGPTYQMSGHGADVPGQFHFKQAQMRRVDAGGWMRGARMRSVPTWLLFGDGVDGVDSAERVVEVIA